MAKADEKHEQSVEETPKQEEQSKADEKQELVELEHFVKDGIMTIGETAYKIVKGKVSVAAEHVQEALKHIKMGG